MMFKRRIKRTPEEAAELAAYNAKLKAEREANAMTCQCCGRKFLANTGTIAHHGYERPGHGYQTSSCIGAKFAPFEVSRERLGLHTKGQKELLKTMVAARAAVNNESKPVHKVTTKRQPAFTTKKEYVHIDVTRETFDAQQTELRTVFHHYGSFDDLKRIDLAKRDGEIRSSKEYIAMQTERFNNWKQTHSWYDGKWVSIGVAMLNVSVDRDIDRARRKK